MKKKLFLLAFTFVMLIGLTFTVVKSYNTDFCETTSVACGRCGDGQCVKSCGENARTCPKDCGVPSAK